MQSTIGSRVTQSPIIWRKALMLATAVSASRSKVTAFPSRVLTHSRSSQDMLCSTQRWMSTDNTPNEDDPRSHILSKSTPEDQAILGSTLNWVQGAVIGLNLCPFAEKPLQQRKMHLEVIQGTDQRDILARVLGECLSRRDHPGTSLMICPDLFPTNFHGFLEVYNMLQDGVLVDNELTEDIQVAPFHPLFEFEGSGKDGIDNFTNRSPYPIFHVLREDEVGQAVEALQGDASKVWKRNIQLLEELDEQLERDQIEALMTGQLKDVTVREKVQGILNDLKKRD